MKLGPSTVKSTATIRFQDCDPFGHLNNARYIDYFLNARTDQIAANYDFQIIQYGSQPSESWVVSKTQIVYLAPAALMEIVSIQTRLIDVNQSQLLVEGIMMDQAERRVKAVCWLEFTYVSLTTGRPAEHPDEMMRFFEGIRFAEPIDTSSFENRLAKMKAARIKTPTV